jgi:hypothetical protein
MDKIAKWPWLSQGFTRLVCLETGPLGGKGYPLLLPLHDKG